eukprot:scaffold301_cov243-Pinguiococcus_pyrenoidosus.AAC.82
MVPLVFTRLICASYDTESPGAHPTPAGNSAISMWFTCCRTRHQEQDPPLRAKPERRAWVPHASSIPALRHSRATPGWISWSFVICPGLSCAETVLSVSKQRRPFEFRSLAPTPSFSHYLPTHLPFHRCFQVPHSHKTCIRIAYVDITRCRARARANAGRALLHTKRKAPAKPES